MVMGDGMDIIGANEAARMLKVTRQTVMRYCTAGLIPAKKERRGHLGRWRWVMERSAVEEFIKAHEVRDE
jgi:hypothetical protein